MIFDALFNAARRLRARPGNTALSIGILSLGLVSALFLFGAINVMVLRPLPFPEADRLVSVGWMQPARGNEVQSFDAADWLAIREALPMFDQVAVQGGPATVNIASGEHVARYNGAMVGANLLRLLDVKPLLGRAFTDEDDQPGAALTVLLGEQVWRNDFGADPQIIGKVIRSNGEAATIIGVMPAWFRYPFDQEAWIPRRLAANDGFTTEVVARLAPGVSLDQAQLALTNLSRDMGERFTPVRDGAVLGLIPLHHSFVEDVVRHTLWMMFGAGLLVLLLACVNVANLQLAAILPRRRELAVRSALGADRRRLLGELMAEAALMAGIATVLAVLGNDLLSHWWMAYISNSGLTVPFYLTPHYDWRDFVFVPLVALATCLCAGLIPALRAAGTDAQDALRDGSKGSHGGAFARIARAMVVGEVALTVVLLIGAAMFLRGIDGMIGFDNGSRSDPATVLTGRVGLFDADYPTTTDRIRFFERVVERLRDDPRVLAASVGNAIPGRNSSGSEEVMAEGAGKPADGYLRVENAFVDDGFAQVYGLRLREGRFFDARDTADSAAVAVIDRRVAERLWPGRPALGQQLVMNPDATEPARLTVVGVMDDLHLRSISASPRASVLRPFAQAPSRFATLALQLRGDAAAFAPALAEAVRGVDPHTPVYWVQSHAEVLRQNRVGTVVLGQMFGGVGVMALILAAAGLYGVLAFSVEQRTREIGIRRAIGSGRVDVVRLVFRRIATQLALGLGIGLALALPWSAMLANPAFHTKAYDPMIFGSVVAMVLGVALASALLPLRRALRVQPMTALRYD